MLPIATTCVLRAVNASNTFAVGALPWTCLGELTARQRPRRFSWIWGREGGGKKGWEEKGKGGTEEGIQEHTSCGNQLHFLKLKLMRKIACRKN